MRKTDKPEEYLKMINLATGLAAIDSLIEKVEDELNKEKSAIAEDRDADRRILALQAETKELAAEVSDLIDLLATLRNVEIGG